MRLPIDTNVLVGALLFRNSWSAQAFRRATSRHIILMSEPLWLEVTEVFQRPKFRKYFSEQEGQQFLDYVAFKAEWVLTRTQIRVCRDPKDNMILELAVSGKADCIVTGDQDLLALDPFQGIRIVTPQAFLEMP